MNARVVRSPRLAFLVGASLTAASVGLALWALRVDLHWGEQHHFVTYCLREPADAARVQALRRAGFVGAAVLLIAAPLLARWTLRQTPSSLFWKVARIVVPALMALPAVELLLRLKPTPPTHGPIGSWPVKPPMTVQFEGIEYAYNREAERVASESDQTDFEKPTILFVGESIVLGHGVRYEDTFPAIVGRELGVQSINMGIFGAPIDQSLDRLREQVTRYSKIVAIVTLFVPELLYRNAVTDRAHDVLDSRGELVREPAAPEWVRNLRVRTIWNLMNHGAPPYHSDDSVAVTRAIYVETARIAEEHRATSLFLVTNYNGPPCTALDGARPWILREVFDQPKLHSVDVYLDQTWIVDPQRERHPDARGHRKLADGVISALRSVRPL